MTPATRETALNIIALTQDWLRNVAAAIEHDEKLEAENTPPAQGTTAAQPAPEEAQQTVARQLDATPVDTDKLHGEAQQLLRDIALKEGTKWITTELFPHFGTNNLGDVPSDKLPELIELINQHNDNQPPF